MIKGIFDVILTSEEKIETYTANNMVLDLGLANIVNGFSITNLLGVGRSDLNPSSTQTGLIDPIIFFNSSYTTNVITPDDDNEYIYLEIDCHVLRDQAIGQWAEIGINGINRSLFKQSGTLDSGTYIYAVSSFNSTGESSLSNIITGTISTISGSNYLQWSGPSNQSINSRVPTGYHVYRDFSGTLLKIKTVSSERLYYYDRGEDFDGTSYIGGAALLGSPESFIVSGTDNPTPKSFFKNDLMEADIKVRLYFGNFDQSIF